MQTLKSLFVTFLMLGGAFLAYDRYLAPDSDKVVFKTAVAPKPAPTVSPPQVAPTSPPSPEPIAPPPQVPPPKPEAPQPKSESAAMPVAAPPTDGFVPPRIPTVEDATLNWTRIPPSAFPRQVRLLQGTTFKASFGNTQAGPGTTVTVLNAQQGTLTIAPNASSTLRATVPLESTDLRFVLTQVYDAWRERRLTDARRAWEQRGAAPVAPPLPANLASVGRPQRGTDGSYPLLLASMKAGIVTEITPQSITHWGDAEQAEVDGKPCWRVPVEFDAVTAFGKFHTEAFARVVDGRVTGWFYKGSGEVVP